MTEPGASRAGRWCAAAAVLSTGGAAAVCIALAAPGRWILVTVLVAALLWGLGGSVAVALTPNRGQGRGRALVEQDPTTPAVRIGTVMHLGDVPDEVARTTSAIAAAVGPVALVVPATRAVPELLDPGVDVVAVGDRMTDLHESCDAVLFVSARALPASGCDEAAARLAAGASWVVGSAEPLNRDRFGPTGRELLDSRLRRAATGTGLWCWEPDATVVRSSLLSSHPFPAGRPLGAWLRDRAAVGLTGATVDLPLARRAAPAAADGYWPDTTARQRAGAADLSDAATRRSTGWRGRAIAAALLVRALSGWSVVLWLAVLVLLAGGSPVQRGDGALAALVVVSAVLRWWAPHLAVGTRPSPLADMVAGLYSLPGSLAATASAMSRKVRPTRRAVPSRPLVWLALIATAAAGIVVLTARPGDDVARVAAGAAAVLLVLLWVFTVRSLVERSWQRVGFRIPLDLSAEVERADAPRGDTRWRLIDGSPGGFGLLGPVTGLARGDEVTVRVPRADTELVLDGTVAARRPVGSGTEVLGVELRAAHPGTAAWAETLLGGASAPSTLEVPIVEEHLEGSSWSRRADRLAIGLVVAASITVMLTLALVLAGFRPLVIRSGSMEPTYSVGDLVLVTAEPAGQLRPGQVATRFDAPQAADSLTHRVTEVDVEGGQVRVTTRGDANDTSEVWSAPVGRQVGVVVTSVPAIGLPFAAARSSLGWGLLLGVAVLGVIAVLFRPRRRDSSLNPPQNRPTETVHTTIGERP